MDDEVPGFEQNNKLYGTTQAGGSSNAGTVFELAPGPNPLGGWQETTLYSFTVGSDGDTPIAGLVSDSTGALYGAAVYGGNFSACSAGCGVIFEVQP